MRKEETMKKRRMFVIKICSLCLFLIGCLLVCSAVCVMEFGGDLNRLQVVIGILSMLPVMFVSELDA